MKIKRFKLNALSEQCLKEKEMNAILGGIKYCTCSCFWENNTGSSSADNRNANYALGYESAQGCNQYMYSDNCHLPYDPRATA